MTYLFVLSFCVYVGSTVGHGENSVQSKTERDTSIAHLMYLFMKDINDIYDESRALKDKIGALEAQILDIDSKTKDLESITEELRWEEWGSWGSCAASCSNGVGERLQSRTRGKKAPGDATSQTESRPCSSVQFAGCQHPNNKDQFYAVMYDYSYVLAQASCTAMASGGHIRAIKRTCSESAADCSAVCKTVGQTCFNSLHVYSGGNAPPLNRDSVEQKSLIMYRYNACGGGCGPNFCCCKS